MNLYRRLANAAISDTRADVPSAAALLERLHADQRDIDQVIQRLQRIQKLRERRLTWFGNLRLSHPASRTHAKSRSGAGRDHIRG
jgi:hypothetical protein